MAKKQKNKVTTQEKRLSPFLIRRLSEGSFILILTLALFVLLSLATYQPMSPNAPQPSNGGGQVGALMAQGLYWSLGYWAFLLPLGVSWVAWIVLKDCRALQRLDRAMLSVRGAGLVFLLCSGCALLALGLSQSALPGGQLGHVIALQLNQSLGLQGAGLVLVAGLLIGITWLTGLSWVRVVLYAVKLLGMALYRLIRAGGALVSALFVFVAQKRRQQREKPALIKMRAPKKSALVSPVPVTPAVATPHRIEKTMAKLPVTGALPSLNLLDKAPVGKPSGGYSAQELEQFSRRVEQHLLDFGVQAEVVDVHPGPVITRFELQLAAGVKASKLSALARDLARSLSVVSVRVVEVIPGKSVVGIELPNQHRAMVGLSGVLGSPVYTQAASHLALALGVDIAGEPMVVDLAKMPHLLVAGTTGSGKSVGINAMILSLLFRATPEQVRLIMVDPKMLELSVYDGIPHLLTPVVTDMKEAASALRWCVGEMERRYRLMAALGVRNLAGYNAKILEAITRKTPLTDPLWKPIDSTDTQAPELQTLPYVVVVIDELADMMMVVGKKVEQLIARIAQKARAAGIHLILATQRPSVDVLTGLIKSNIPTRISFQVSSKIDSRTILDQQGAEQLLGHGDMLFLAPGTGAPLRIHGAFVSDEDVHRVADDWRARGKPDYIEEITQQNGDGLDGFGAEEGERTENTDPLYDQAVEFVVQSRKASISAVQRKLKIGYNRAACLIEEMERTGIVGSMDGGFREVLVNTVED